jgi:photosystem II stability/assembly factor-like uncharacterized protein
MAAAMVTTGSGPGGATPSWHLTHTGVTARLRGLAPATDKIAWVSGSEGTILRTVDGGRNWASVGPPGAVQLQFCDMEAFDHHRAVALTIGAGDQSRVYVTSDGGATWQETFRNDEPAAFYDCLTFLDRRHGLALSDPVDGRFRILATADAGRSWAVLPPSGMPDALPGESAFAASGSCLVSSNGRAYFATGGGARSRVFISRNGGRTWVAADSPIPSGPNAGIHSLAFRDPWHGIAVGGDHTAPSAAPHGSATTRDGGHTWTLSTTAPGGYRSGSAWLNTNTTVAVGPTGSDISRDGGRTWSVFDSGSFDAVKCTHHGTCWACGEHGRVALLRWGRGRAATTTARRAQDGS